VTLVTLHTVQAATVDGDNRTLHVNEIVLTQLFLIPFNQTLCHIMPWVATLKAEGKKEGKRKKEEGKRGQARRRTASSTSAAIAL
jgi:hypothetical protein